MWPTRRLPASVTATIEGVVLYPPRLGITVGIPFSTIATHELVVPRSMPITFSIRPHLPAKIVLSTCAQTATPGVRFSPSSQFFLSSPLSYHPAARVARLYRARAER